VLQALGLTPEAVSRCRVLVAVLSAEERPHMYGIASALRGAGIPAELYLGDQFSFRHQIAYAGQQGIPHLLIQGENERARGVVALRNLASRTQEEMPLETAAARLRS